jgi:pimeloyl-ACP methyl ester carboxylesterase
MANTPADRMVQAPHGVSLWTQSFGDPKGHPLLLIMGAMNQGVFWPDAFCEQLAARGCLVIRYDHRDTGASSITQGAAQHYTLTDLTDDALSILDAYGLDRASVMGLSMGGYIAQLMAALHPGRVDRLILLSTSADHRPYMAATTGGDLGPLALPPPTERFLSYLEGLRQHPPGDAQAHAQSMVDGWRATHGGTSPFPEAEVRHLLELAQSRTQEAAAAFRHGNAVGASPPRTDLLGLITAPTLVIHGQDDPCLPLAHGQHLAAHIAGARLLTLDMGHMLPPAVALSLVPVVADFLTHARP